MAQNKGLNRAILKDIQLRYMNVLVQKKVCIWACLGAYFVGSKKRVD